jgi:hypothetical protein
MDSVPAYMERYRGYRFTYGKFRIQEPALQPDGITIDSFLDRKDGPFSIRHSSGAA